MWWVYDEGQLYTRAVGIDESSAAAHVKLSRKQPHAYDRQPRIKRVTYDGGARAIHVYGDLYVLFNNQDKQLCVGSLDDCDMTLVDYEGDCARARMDYEAGITALWADTDVPPSVTI